MRPKLRQAFDALLEAKRGMEALDSEAGKSDDRTSGKFSGMGFMEEWALIITSSSSGLSWTDEEKHEFIKACREQDEDDRQRRRLLP